MDSWWLPDDDQVKLTFKDFDIKFDTELTVDEHGSLEPAIQSVSIDFGDSEFVHDNWFVNIFVWPIAKFAVQVIEVLPSFVGDFFFSDMLTPFLDAYMNDYSLPLTIKSPFNGQDTEAKLKFDFRNT